MEKLTRKNRRSTGIFITIQIIIVMISVAVGFLISEVRGQSNGELNLLQQAREIVINNTILELPPERAMEYGMIRGFLETLKDPYSIFVEPAANEIQSNELTGNYGGVGVRLEQDTQMIWRLYPMPGSPAIEAGIKDGDLLVSVEDKMITPDMDKVALIAALRGPVGEKVKITIQRDDEILDFRIRRESISLPSVSYNLIPEETRIGMIKINRISDTTKDEIKTGIQDLSENGAQGFILDLRNNGGGLVDSGVEIARLFLEDGEIMRRQFKGQEVEISKVEKPGPFTHYPMVVFVNGNTASAAEIVAGAINNTNKAALIGQPTFGKTTIQFIFDLEDGSSVHITSGRWWITGQDFPLEPDLMIPADGTNADFLQAAINALKDNIE